MSMQKMTGRTVRIEDEVFIVTCDKAVPRHYLVAATMLLAMMIPQLLGGEGEELRAVLYAAFTGLATLGLSWLFDDREPYRLRKVLHLPVAVASPEAPPADSAAESAPESGRHPSGDTCGR